MVGILLLGIFLQVFLFLGFALNPRVSRAWAPGMGVGVFNSVMEAGPFRPLTSTSAKYSFVLTFLLSANVSSML